MSQLEQRKTILNSGHRYYKTILLIDIMTNAFLDVRTESFYGACTAELRCLTSDSNQRFVVQRLLCTFLASAILTDEGSNKNHFALPHYFHQLDISFSYSGFRRAMILQFLMPANAHSLFTCWYLNPIIANHVYELDLSSAILASETRSTLIGG